MSTRPDLTTKAARKAYKHEVRMVAVRPRRAGLALLGAAMVLIALPFAGVHSIGGLGPQFLAVVAVALATPLLVASIILRRRYVEKRLGGEE